MSGDRRGFQGDSSFYLNPVSDVATRVLLVHNEPPADASSAKNEIVCKLRRRFWQNALQTLLLLVLPAPAAADDTADDGAVASATVATAFSLQS
jgi:hypothetical protein